MSGAAVLRILLFLLLLLACALPLGRYMARVYSGELRWAGRLERLFYRLAGIDPGAEMGWRHYAAALLVFNLLGLVAVFAIQRFQWGMPPVPPLVALNTAVSFVTNTNWQAYSGETTMSASTQMLALTVQNFVSAATGMAVLVALIRGFARHNAEGLGNFWVDLTRTVLYILLPLSVILALVLVSQGVVQTFSAHEGLVLGPVASQVAIKQLGTNGGGFFNANSAHPFENPNALANLLEMLAILALPAALCLTFGALVKRRRQGWAILAAMLLLFVPPLVATVAFEQRVDPSLVAMGIDPSGGNMEGKEVRFGVVDSAIWATATTAASNGSVNASLDSFTPLGGLVPMVLMQLGEVVFGGVGSGLYGMLLYLLIAVFIAGLMVGRTPELLGKKIEAFEMKMAALAILLPSAAVLIGTALATLLPAGSAPVGNPGPHGFSEILYAFSSGANNNGSAFGGLTADGPFYTLAIALVMLVGRYGVIVPVLAIGGSLVRKKEIPVSAGTLPTDTPLFVVLLVGTVVLVGALTFIPALALGPVIEHLRLAGH